MTAPDAYAWLKGLHVAAALLFVGGVLAETAFLAAHVTSGDPAAQRPTYAAFRAWDRRLTTPAMLLVWALGIGLASWAGWFQAAWLQAKLVLVLALSALHGVQSGTIRRLAAGTGRPPSQRVPLLIILVATVLIALLAVAKPF